MDTPTQSGKTYSRNGKTLYSPNFGYIASVTGCNSNPKVAELIDTKALNKLKRKFNKKKGRGA